MMQSVTGFFFSDVILQFKKEKEKSQHSSYCYGGLTSFISGKHSP